MARCLASAATGSYSVCNVAVTARVLSGGHEEELIGRRVECDVLERLVTAIRSGESRALVLHGDPGAGKTALLDYLAGRAEGCQVLRAAGVQSEMELAFATLHQLCAPMLDHGECLPAPQRDALQTAFGMKAGPPRTASWWPWPR